VVGRLVDGRRRAGAQPHGRRVDVFQLIETRARSGRAREAEGIIQEQGIGIVVIVLVEGVLRGAEEVGVAVVGEGREGGKVILAEVGGVHRTVVCVSIALSGVQMWLLLLQVGRICLCSVAHRRVIDMGWTMRINLMGSG